MPVNVINLYKRLENKYQDIKLTNEDDDTLEFLQFVDCLNKQKSKGIVLKEFGFLKKGERWENKDLISFLTKKGYKKVLSDEYKYIFVNSLIESKKTFKKELEEFEILIKK